MKIRLIVKGDDDSKIEIDLTPRPGAEARVISHPTLVWQDLATTRLGQGKTLKRWSLKRSGQAKWKGLASDQGPKLADGDRVTFYVETKRN